MKIKAISVTHLFGVFNHVIPLNTEERITIIHGRNGFGKTILLQMIDGLFNFRYSIFRDTPFEKFRVEFVDDKSYIEVTKNPQQGSSESSLTCRFRDLCNQFPSQEELSLLLPPLPTSSLSENELDSIDELIPELNRVESKLWVSAITEEFYSLEDVLERFGRRLPFLANKEEESQKRFRDLITVIKVHLVGIDRLQKSPSKDSDQSIEIISRGGRGVVVNKRGKITLAVPGYAKELSQQIKSKLTEYGSLSQKLDRTFPTRLFKETISASLTDEELHKRLEQIDGKRSELKEVGLLDRETEETSPFSPEGDLARRVLPIYIQDVEQKLSVFDQDQLAGKLKKFKDIINRHFYHKQMTIDKEQGVVFETATGQSLSPNHLSSGEQHQFILLYELLFKVAPHSLLLIDEPELSLHLEWQREFLKDVQEIIRLVDYEVIIATHSPNIIGNRRDLTVALKDTPA